ncbi:PQQ-binding-like beta-propeller repeat protein [Kosmotoga sp. DU53]|uniref:outer membrane protein assembly factor BamB family protein n=1 Tax=Kosmotoga sp. DU53 TaxID=1310160 RepID=UPI0007C5090D|nr:PQQ-binding-like beta-propeller repeat protein [Kosmotoga sp. DU53]OAA21419.1 hypothetical protein DU53_05795 [Kosmotoga sp. DU53]
MKKVVIISVVIILCFLASSCSSLLPHENNYVQLYMKLKFEPEISFCTHPSECIYDEETGVVYTRGREELVAAIDINRKKLLWDRRIRSDNKRVFDIELGGDNIYIIRVASKEASSAILALNKRTGEITWEYLLEDGSPDNGMALHNGFLYAVEYMRDGYSTVIKLDSENGREIWKSERIIAPKATDPVIDQERGLLYIGSMDYQDIYDYNPTFYAIEIETGKIVWKYEVKSKYRDDFYTVPSIYGDSVYAATWFGLVLRLKRDTGEVVWKRRYFFDDNSVYAVNWGFGNRLQIYDDKLILMMPGGYIYALDTENGDVVWRAWTRYSADDVYLDKESGRIYVHNWGPEIRCYTAPLKNWTGKK